MEKKKLLVVDDVPDNLAIIYRTLHDDYEIIGANSGMEALRLVSVSKPDLILLDIMMPDMNGYEVCRILKEQDEFCDIPIIFVTALVEETDESKGFDLGAVDYITKPFKPAILKHRISTQLQLKSQKDVLALKNEELEAALANVKELTGLLPICMYCKKIRDDKGYWNQLEAYISQHSEALFSHGICPECFEKEMSKMNKV